LCKHGTVKHVILQHVSLSLADKLKKSLKGIFLARRFVILLALLRNAILTYNTLTQFTTQNWLPILVKEQNVSQKKKKRLNDG